MLSTSENSKEVKFSETDLQRFNDLVSRYPEERKKSALLPILHEVQARFGWLSSEAMDAVASYLKIESIEVYEVATFYTMFFLKPTGKYTLEVCRTGPCCLVGAEDMLQYIEEKLGVKEHEVTDDGLFSWRGVECLAACGTGPVLQIGPDYTYHEKLTKERVDELIEQLTSKHKNT